MRRNSSQDGPAREEGTTLPSNALIAASALRDGGWQSRPLVDVGGVAVLAVARVASPVGGGIGGGGRLAAAGDDAVCVGAGCLLLAEPGCDRADLGRLQTREYAR